MSSAERALITEVPLTWGICHQPQHRRLPLYLARSSCHTPGNHPYLYPKVNIDSIWYVMNCVPTNSYTEAVTPSILECDCTCRLGLERDGGGAQVLSHVQFVTPCTVAHQAPLSLGLPPGKSTAMGCHFLLQGIFPTQGSNPQFLPWLLHCREILYH